MIKFHSHLNGPLKTDASDNHSEVPQDGEPEKQLFTTHQPLQPLFGQKKCTKSEVEWFYGLHLWKRCPLPNVKGKKSTVHTKLILFVSQRCIRLIIFEHFQGIYTNKNRRHLWKPEWLQQNEFSSLEIPFGVPSVEIWAWSYQSHFSSLLHL